MYNNRNNEGRHELYKEQYRASRRKKMKRRRIVFYIIAGIIIAAGLFFSGKFLMDFLSNKVVKEAPVETKVEAEVPVAPTEFIKGESNITIDFLSTVPKEINFQAILPGKNHSIAASSHAYPLPDVKMWMKGEGDFEDKKIAFLTFDDGPVSNTVKVLDILKKKNVPGTFFLTGNALSGYGDQTILHRYIEEGHAIATHSYSHDYNYLYPGRSANPERHVEEYRRLHGLIQETLGESFHSGVFRFPGGAMSWKNIPAAQEALLAEGVVDVDWNSMSGDSEPKSRKPANASAMADFVFTTLNQNNHTNVAMVLMHDLKGETSEYLEKVIDGFIERGYSFGILE